MYKLIVKQHFDAAHFLKDYGGKCSREHGHRWDVEVCLRGRELDGLNMLVDFGAVKASMKGLLDRLDHYQLNQELCEDNPTAEFIAKWIFDRLDHVAGSGNDLELAYVCVWESPECCVEYDGK